MRGASVCDLGVLAEFERVCDFLVCEGEVVLEGMHLGCCGFRELRVLLKWLRLFKDLYLLFIRDYGAPFTDNLAERDLCHCKTRWKVLGCFRSWRGLVCVMREFAVFSLL